MAPYTYLQPPTSVSHSGINSAGQGAEDRENDEAAESSFRATRRGKRTTQMAPPASNRAVAAVPSALQ